MPASTWRWLAAAGLVGLLSAAAPAASALTAEPTAKVAPAAQPTSPRMADGWIDGGDDLPCVDDETCLWIEGCKLDGDNNPVYPNHNGTHVGGGSYSYADDTPSATPTPTPTASSSPTKAPSASPTKSPSSHPTSHPSSSSGGTKGPSGSSSSPTPTSSASTTEDATEESSEEPAAVAGGALSAPTLSADGSDLTVTWAAPGGERTDLAGYTVKVLAGPAEQVDAETTAYTFAGLPDGVYAAQVTARYDEGEPETSPVSEKLTIGQDPTKVVGTVTVTGDVVAGERLTVTGTGFAPGTDGFQVELHSSPVVLASIQTDASGAFQVETTVPDTVPAGDHTVVVIYDNVEVASTPVTVAAAAAAPTEAASVGSTAPDTSRGGLILLAGLVAIGAVVLVGYGVSKRRRTGERPSSAVDEEVHPAIV